MKNWRTIAIGTYAFALTSSIVMVCIAIRYGDIHSMHQVVRAAPFFISLEVLLLVLLMSALCQLRFLMGKWLMTYCISLFLAFFIASQISLSTFYPLPRFGGMSLTSYLFLYYVLTPLLHFFVFGSIIAIPLSALVFWAFLRGAER